MVPQTIILMNSSVILEALGQPQESIIVAQDFIKYNLIGAFLNMQFEATRRFLISQGVFKPVLYILVFTSIFHVLGLTIAVLYLELDILGIGLVTTLTFTLNFIFINAYIYTNSKIICADKWFFQDKEAMLRIPEYLKYGIPTALMLIFEWLGYDIMTVYAGWIGPEEQATNYIMFQMWFLIFTNSLGVTFSTTSLVGNALGANKPKAARKYTYAALMFGSTMVIVLLFFNWIFRNQIIRAFTSDEEVIDLYQQ